MRRIPPLSEPQGILSFVQERPLVGSAALRTCMANNHKPNSLDDVGYTH